MWRECLVTGPGLIVPGLVSYVERVSGNRTRANSARIGKLCGESVW